MLSLYLRPNIRPLAKNQEKPPPHPTPFPSSNVLYTCHWSWTKSWRAGRWAETCGTCFHTRRTYGEDRRNTIGGWEMRGGRGGGGETHVSLGTKEEPSGNRTRNSSITPLQTEHWLFTNSCIRQDRERCTGQETLQQLLLYRQDMDSSLTHV
jgi:hypothetical protein